MAFSLRLGTLSVTIGADTTPLSKAEKQVKRTSKKMGNDFSRLKGIIAGVFTVELARRVVVLADNMNLLDAKVKSVSRSAKEFETVRKGIRDIARETGASIQNVSTMAQRMLIAGDNLNATTEQILSATDAFNKLGIIGGATFDQMKFAQLQFGQAMSGNIVRAEEFNSLIENTPLIAKEIAKGMNLSVGALQRGVKEGKILSKDVFAALLKRTDSIKAKWEEFPLTISRATGVLTNSIAEAIQKIDEEVGVTSALAEAMISVSEAINELVKDGDRLTEVIENVKSVFEALAFVLIARVGVSFSALATSMKGAAAGSVLLDLALGRSMTTMVNVNGVMTKMPVKLKLAARGMLFLKNAARGLLAIFGGIPGLIFTVITSLALFVDWSSDAEKAAKKTKEALEGQTKAFKDLDQAAKDVVLKDLVRQQLALTVSMAEQRAEIRKLKKEQEDLAAINAAAGNTFDASGSSIDHATEKLQKLRMEYEKVQALITQGLGDSNDDPVTDEPPTATASTFDFKDIDAELKKQKESLEDLNQLESQVMQNRLDRFLIEQGILLQKNNATKKEIEAFFKKEKEIQKIFAKSKKVQEKIEKDAAAKKAERQRRQAEIEKDNRARDQQAIVTDLGAVIGAEQEAAIISAGISLQRAIAKAMEKGSVGFAEIAGITGAFANLISSIKAAKAPGRAFGGTVSSGQATPINERGTPEVFMNNAGRQFLLPNEAGKVIPLSSDGGGSGGMSVMIVNNSSAEVSEPVVTEGKLMIEINNAEERIINGINTSLSTGRGETAEALRSGFEQTRNI